MTAAIPRQRAESDHLVHYQLAAAFFAIPASTLRRWVHVGKIGRYGTPRCLLVDVREVRHARDTLKRPRAERRA